MIDQEMLSRAWRTFLSGLVTVLPLMVTVYLIYWLVRLAESAFGGIARVLLPEGWYVPGFGVLLAGAAIFAIGVFVQQVVFSRLVEIAEGMLARIPVVKTIYTAVRDILDFISSASRRSDLKRVVLVEVRPDTHIIGFVTDDQPVQVLPELVGADTDTDGSDLVSVYMPMSYMVGGYTVYLPSARLKPLDISIEEAMRVALTAGVNRPRRGEAAAAHGAGGADEPASPV